MCDEGTDWCDLWAPNPAEEHPALSAHGVASPSLDQGMSTEENCKAEDIDQLSCKENVDRSYQSQSGEANLKIVPELVLCVT